jgi:hypothetical protein
MDGLVLDECLCVLRWQKRKVVMRYEMMKNMFCGLWWCVQWNERRLGDTA